MRFENPDAAARHGIARSLAQYIDSLSAPPVSVRNILANAAGIEPLGSAERDLRARMELLRGEQFLGETVIPWSALTTRGMLASVGGKGGYALESDLLPMQDVLRGDSVIIEVGAQTFDNLTAVVSIPRLVTKPTMSFVGESADSGSTDPALGSVSATVRTMLGRITVSAQLLKQSGVEQILRDVLRRGVADKLDAVAIAGVGGVEPLGILNAPGIGSASGTALSYASIWAQVKALLAAGAKQSELFMVCGPTAAEVLGTRERAAGSGYILDDGRIGGIPCSVSVNVPASTLLLGVASQVAICTWGAGPEIRTSQSSGFNTAQIDVRIKLDCDVSVLQPGAFTSFATVT